MLKVLPILRCDYLFFRKLIYVIFVRDCSCFEFYTLREKWPYSEFFWSVFSRIFRISPHSVQMRSNTDQKFPNTDTSRSDSNKMADFRKRTKILALPSKIFFCRKKTLQSCIQGSKTFQMERFTVIGNCFYPLTIVAKFSTTNNMS